ncbi:zf-HC2 domain-containing protein [Streptomyces sp. NBC_00094]|uniref:zf-HC2 domain-containing protein n=1 Tax=Streptomyces sp. NBC_00094 TaxID=2903620 RepID=UPI002251586B|nr:zf-HC2 domain-containing protein [Streptomyces sp. NBC_00094]MCX5391873.1 zf-HC2 domain-containing protein [Streptomyces sp. NBC_00094]
MTSTTGKADTTQHPDVSEISDLTEGLLSPTRSAAVRRHLDGCPLCADVRASLDEIRGLLGTLPGPPRMPAEIAGRIDAALAAEALLQATAPESGSPVSRETARAGSQPLPSGSPSSPAAERPAGRPKAATGPGRPGKPRRRRIALVSTLGAAFAAAVLGTSLFLSQGGAPTAGSADTAKKADVNAVATSPFSGTPVEERVHALLRDEGGKTDTPQGIGPESMSAESTTTAPQRNRDSAIPACVLAGTGRADAVLAHERGEYQGTPAYLLVLADPTAGTRVQAFVLDASCAARPTTTGGPAAEVLLSQTYPRS